MASAEKVTIHREVTKVVEEEGVTLTLNKTEARVLAFILGSVGGQQDGPRGVADGIANELIAFTGWVHTSEFPVEPENRAIYFLKEASVD